MTRKEHRMIARIYRYIEFSDRRIKTWSVVVLLFLIAGHLFPVPIFAQDATLPPKPVLPFQQDANKPVNEEQLAMQLYAARDFVKAAEIFERIYQQKPHEYIYQYLLLSLIEIQEYGQAEKLVKKNLKADPGAIKYRVDLGYIAYRRGETSKAKKAYEEALRELQPNQQQIFELANAFITKGENEYAIQTYRKGRELLGNPGLFGFEIAGVYERMGDFRNAIEEYLNLLEVSTGYLNTVQDRIQMTLNFDINNEKNAIIRKILLSRAQKYPDKTVYAELLWWYSIQQKDFDLALVQAKALDRRLKEKGEKLIQLANLALSNQQYDIAIACYEALVDKGEDSPFYDVGRRELINTRYLKILSRPSPSIKEITALSGEMERELRTQGENPENSVLLRNLAHLRAFYLGRPDSAISLLNRAIRMGGLPLMDKSQCKLELGDIYLFTGEVWEATLLYQQVYLDFKNDVLGQEAKFRNTMLSFYIGEFSWAAAQADILKAATSKFISNDAIALSLLISENYDPDSSTVALEKYSRAELYDFRNQEEQALKSLDSISAMFSDHPILMHVAYKKALIRIKQGYFPEADSMLARLIREYPDGVLTDEALMKRAAVNMAHLGNNEVAKTCFQEVIDKFPSSIFVPEARRQFRILRGDNLP